MVYFLVSDDGRFCKIGYTTDMVRRCREMKSNNIWEFFAAIDGSEVNERACHVHFSALHHKDEMFRLEGELKEYLEWLGTRAFAATTLAELDCVYPHDNRFPFTNWRVEDLKDGVQGELPIDQIVPGVRKPLTRSQRILVTIRSQSDEWHTPPLYTRAAREVMGGIDLDPASSALANQHVKATAIYTRADDGLRYDWKGRVWMNPPFGNEKDRFVDHLLHEYEAGRVEQAVMCLNAHATDARWFQQLWAHPICFTHHRPKFRGGQGNTDDPNPTTGIVFVYAGFNEARFAEVFSRFGPIVRCERPASTDRSELRRLQSEGGDWADE